MRRRQNYLNTASWAFVGSFLGTSAVRIWEYCKRPELYAMQSAPWYTQILFNALTTAVIVLLLQLIRRCIRK